eukprot:scaffold2636_cov340-Pavlova_lutheri.AAC.157
MGGVKSEVNLRATPRAPFPSQTVVGGDTCPPPSTDTNPSHPDRIRSWLGHQGEFLLGRG